MARRPASSAAIARDGAGVPAAPTASRSDLILLRLAAQKNQLSRLQQLLAKGVPADTALDGGTTALVLAAQHGHIESVSVLLQHGADVFAQRASDGATALLVAISAEHTAIVRLLLDRRAAATSDPLTVTLRVVTAGTTTRVVADVIDKRSSDEAAATTTTNAPKLTIDVSQGHLAVLHELVDRNDAVCWTTGSLDVALRIACQATDVAMVTKLLARSVDPYMRSSDGLTPLVQAIALGNLDVIDALLDTHSAAAGRDKVSMELFFGTTTTGTDSNGDSDDATVVIAAVLEPTTTTGKSREPHAPLLLSLTERHLDVVHLLLAKTARLAWRGLSLEVALFAAAQVGHLDLVQSLLERHARADFVSPDGVTPLVIASANGHAAIVRALLDNGECPYDEAVLARPLSVAAERGHAEVVTLLLAHGAEVNVADDDDGPLPLTLAAANGHRDVVAVLLQCDDVAVEWDVDAAASAVVALVAAQHGHAHIVAEYLDEGGDANVCDTDGESLLFAASTAGDVAVVTLLLDSGALADRSDVATRVTPLLIAAQDGFADIVAVLLSHGASVSAHETTQGVTALLMAAQNGHADIVEVLLKHGADVGDRRSDGAGPLVLAASHGHCDVVRALLQARKAATVQASDDSLENALVYAAQAGHLDVVRMLLTHSADVCFTSADGVTPLAAAAQSGHAAVLSELLSSSSSSHTLSEAAKGVALLVAAQSGHCDAVVALLEHGADAQFATDDGVTALQLADAGGFDDVASVLRDSKVGS